MTKDEKDDDKDRREPLEQGLTFVRCPIHGLAYPQGSSCPACASQEEEGRE